MMGLGLTMNLKLTMVCTTCGEQGDDHDYSCPTDLKKKALDGAMRWECHVVACGGEVMVTTEDLLQCRSCATRYSRGEFCDIEEATEVLLHRVSPHEDYDLVKVFDKRGVKGKTVFKVDRLVKRLREEEILWRRRRREEKRRPKVSDVREG